LHFVLESTNFFLQVFKIKVCFLRLNDGVLLLEGTLCLLKLEKMPKKLVVKKNVVTLCFKT